MKNFPFSAKNGGHFCPRKILKDTVSVRLSAALFDFIRLRTRALTMYVCMKKLRGIVSLSSFKGKSLFHGVGVL